MGSWDSRRPSIVEEDQDLFVTLAKSMDMCFANSLFDKPNKQKIAFQLLGAWDEEGHWKEGENTQIDFNAINADSKKAVLHASSDPSWHLDSDHHPVTATMQCRFKKHQAPKSGGVTQDSEKQTWLNKQEMNGFFRARLGNQEVHHY